MTQGEKAYCRFCRDHFEEGPTIMEAIRKLAKHVREKHPEQVQKELGAKETEQHGAP